MWERAGSKALMQAGVNTFTAGANSLFGILNAKKIAKINYKYNEMAADNADTRARALYKDLESPMATISQLKEAGLSPSLYASGNVGGSIGANGAQGQGASGVSMPNGMMSPIDIAGIEVQEAQARKLNAEADELEGLNKMGQAKIAELFASAGLKDAQKVYTEAETRMQNIENYIADETKEFSIAKIKYNASEAEHNANKAFWDAENAQFEWTWNVETYEQQKEKLANEMALLAAQAAYANSGAELNAEEKKHIKDFAQAAIDNATAHKESATQYGNYVANVKDIAQKELEVRKDELNVKKWEIGVNAFTDVLQAGMHMLGLSMFASGRSEKLVEHFDANRHLTGGTKTQTRRAGGRKK